jgi:hypothetical protein
MDDPEFLKIMKTAGENLSPKYGDDFFQIWKNDFEGYSGVAKKMGLGQ